MEAKLFYADLHRTFLSEANLGMAQFNLSDLCGADLADAKLHTTIFVDTNLKDATGLQACVHKGPSKLSDSD